MTVFKMWNWSEWGDTKMTDKKFKLQNSRTGKVCYFVRNGKKVYQTNWSLYDSSKRREVTFTNDLSNYGR
jgi:hypothetical protein